MTVVGGVGVGGWTKFEKRGLGNIVGFQKIGAGLGTLCQLWFKFKVLYLLF